MARGRHALVVEERHHDRVARGPLVEGVGGRGERAVLGAQFAPRRVVPGRERRVYEVRLQLASVLLDASYLPAHASSSNTCALAAAVSHKCIVLAKFMRVALLRAVR